MGKYEGHWRGEFPHIWSILAAGSSCNLSFERKVDLIDSSDKQTQVATSVIYESMPYEERVSVVEKVTDVVNVGDKVKTEVIKVDDKGRIDLRLIEKL